MPSALIRTLRLMLIALAALTTFVVLYVLGALSLARIPVPAEVVDSKVVTAFILSNGVHTDIVLPVRSGDVDWTHNVSFAHTTGRDSSARWVAFGWGDKGFYLETPTWADLTAIVAFKAMFGLGNSAIHATFHRQVPQGPLCKQITLSREQYQRLSTYIRSSFALDAQGRTQVIATKANYGSTDAFYEGLGSYSLFHTCNSWTNEALKACGQKACLWTPMDTGILRQYE